MNLNHTIVPARDNEASAKFFAQIFGLTYAGRQGHFAPVRVNGELTMDFDTWDSFEHHHYAFMVSDEEFEGIFDRVKAAGIPYGSGPMSQDNMEVNARRGGRGFYFRDLDGHSLEVMTR